MGKQAGGVARATKSEILSSVAKRTSFTKLQVDEVFSAYREILDEVINANNRPYNFEMCIPHLGYIVFTRKEGYQLGGKLSLGGKFGGNNETYIEDMTGKWVQPYDRIKVRIDKNIRLSLKEKSRAKILRDKEIKEKLGKEE